MGWQDTSKLFCLLVEGPLTCQGQFNLANRSALQVNICTTSCMSADTSRGLLLDLSHMYCKTSQYHLKLVLGEKK